MGRRLSPDEHALWARLRASVRPIHPTTANVPAIDPAPRRGVAVKPIAATPVPPPPKPRPAGDTLDRGWDRRLAGGQVPLDRTVDLHGHTLASAHALLDAELDRAIARGDRVILLVTGKPPRPESERPHARGAIRAAIRDWIALSRHAPHIAAIRGAHPRHGGAGALYLVLRRRTALEKSKRKKL